MVRLLKPDEITPTAERQLLSLVNQWREGLELIDDIVFGTRLDDGGPHP